MCSSRPVTARDAMMIWAAARVAAQHSQNYGIWYAHVPGLVVIAPYSAADEKGLKAAIA